MRKIMVVLITLSFLLLGSIVQADWISDMPKHKGVNYLGMHFDKQGNKGVITIKTEKGECIKYLVIDDEIVQVKKCLDDTWQDFNKKGKE
jgi:hypothetical protein